MAEANIARTLFSQGFGTRNVCDGMAKTPRVRIVDQTLIVDDERWPICEKAYLALHKPAGYECSRAPSHWPSVHDLLPDPLNNRPVKGGQNGVQTVGRLDQDTTGLLLLSDDGSFIHKMNSPKHHVAKVYEVRCTEPVSEAQMHGLLTGVTLHDSPAPVRATACIQTADDALTLTLTEGKYHQVKRMIAAVGNHVATLHRSRVGGFVLPESLAPGHWMWLDAAALALVTQK